MLRQLLLSDVRTTGPADSEGWALLAREFPTVAVQPLGAGVGAQVLSMDAQTWLSPSFDPFAWDARVFAAAGEERLALHLMGAQGEQLAQAGLEILTRYQGLIGRRNPASSGAVFGQILSHHRSLHDLNKPLTHADYRHALDTWQWVLRLEPEASLEVQVAALFHDVERLLSEGDFRIEHKAEDYQLFKDAHAALGAELTCSLLEELDLDAATCERVRWLITRHERTGEDAALALLNDADALSFFSLNSSGFIRYFSPEHSRKKVAYTLARLRPQYHAQLRRMRLAPAVRGMVEALLPFSGLAAQEGVA